MPSFPDLPHTGNHLTWSSLKPLSRPQKQMKQTWSPNIHPRYMAGVIPTSSARYLHHKRSLSAIEQLRPAFQLDAPPPHHQSAQRSKFLLQADTAMCVLLPVLRLPQSKLHPSKHSGQRRMKRHPTNTICYPGQLYFEHGPRERAKDGNTTQMFTSTKSMSRVQRSS